MSASLTQSLLGSRLGALTLVRVIGKGASAVVYHSRSQHGSQYAVKAIERPQSDPRRRKKTFKEVIIHTRVSSHPNVIPLLDAFSDRRRSDDGAWPRYTYLVLPLADSGDLYSHILEEKRYLNDPVLIRSVFLQILSAVVHCHSLGVYHRDIKSENILTFDEGGRIMLADFGLATTQAHSREWGVGTLNYMSPECIGGSYEPDLGYSSAANDVWSLGVLLINLLTARNPWRKATSSDTTFVEYCQHPSDFFRRAFPISQQVNAVLKNVFMAEEYRTSVAELMGSTAATRVWYDDNAVFDGCMARWRQPEDHVGRDGWVCAAPSPELSEDSALGFEDLILDQGWDMPVSLFSDVSGQGLAYNEESAETFSDDHVEHTPASTEQPHLYPPPRLVIPNPSVSSDSFGSPPPLSSTSSLSKSFPETPTGVQLPGVDAMPKIAEVSHMEIPTDPFQWICTSEVTDLRKPPHPRLYRCHSH